MTTSPPTRTRARERNRRTARDRSLARVPRSVLSRLGSKAALAAIAAAIVLVAVIAIVASRCSHEPAPAPAEPPPVEVIGTVGVEPTLRFDKPLTITNPGATTIWPGSGPTLRRGDALLLNLFAQDGRDGSVIQSTFGDAPVWKQMTVESLGRNLYAALSGANVGARLLYLENDGDVPIVLVVDVLPTRAQGEPVTPPTPSGNSSATSSVNTPADRRAIVVSRRVS